LASTDPHAQTFVTVSNDEVAAVVIKSNSFRERVRKGMKTIGHKLQVFSSGRYRSRSIGDGTSSPDASAPVSVIASQISLTRPRTALHMAAETDASPSILPTPFGSLSRRLSTLAPNPDPTHPPSPNTPPIHGFVVHRKAAHDTLIPSSEAYISSLDSTASIEKHRPELSPSSSLRRRQSSDIDVLGRQRSPSNASSSGTGLGSKIVRLLSRTGSQRSRSRRAEQLPSDAEVSPGSSPVRAMHRMSLDEGLPRRSIDTLESSSYSSGRPGLEGLPEMSWESRLQQQAGPIRRGSQRSEDFIRGVQEEEVDWNETLSDGDEDVEPDAGPVAWRHEGLGLSTLQPVSTAPALQTIPDASPTGAVEPLHEASSLELPQRATSRTSSRGSHSPYRANFQPERTRSPLGRTEEVSTSPLRLRQTVVEEDDEGLAISIGSKRGRKGSMLGSKSIHADA
jgi:hypothetical protein